MLTLIEAETTNKLKSSQTSKFQDVYIYTSKVRSLQLHRVDLPNFFFTQLVGNRLFRCSTAKCYSKKFEERKRSCFHARPVRRQALERGTDVWTKNDATHHGEGISTPVGVCDQAFCGRLNKQFLDTKVISNYFSNRAKCPPRSIDQIRWHRSCQNQSGLKLWGRKSPGDENNFPRSGGEESGNEALQPRLHRSSLHLQARSSGPLLKVRALRFSFIYDCPLHVSLTTILAAVSPSHVNGQSARSGGWQTSSREQPRRLPKRRWHGRKRSCRTERSCRERD